MKQYASAGMKYPVVTGETGGDDALLKSFGSEAVGLVSACPYSLDLQTDGNQRFVSEIMKNYDVIPGQYAALLYVNCMVVDAALKALGGDASDKDKFIAALKAVSLTDTPRGPRAPNTASSSGTRRSTLMKTSASSGRGRKRNSSLTRSIRAIIRH
jgi:branched-chain amino acid transport system substrate-binding protein